jgi:hypothetical protein
VSLSLQLGSLVDAARDAYLEDARRRLAAATDLSLNEEVVLKELGEPHELAGAPSRPRTAGPWPSPVACPRKNGAVAT